MLLTKRRSWFMVADCSTHDLASATRKARSPSCPMSWRHHSVGLLTEWRRRLAMISVVCVSVGMLGFFSGDCGCERRWRRSWRRRRSCRTCTASRWLSSRTNLLGYVKRATSARNSLKWDTVCSSVYSNFFGLAAADSDNFDCVLKGGFQPDATQATCVKFHAMQAMHAVSLH